jgi:hypothetical protein
VTSAFASQSTGLKVKGDGLHFPPDNYDPSYQWGECPSFVPGTISSLRAASLRSHMCTRLSSLLSQASVRTSAVLPGARLEDLRAEGRLKACVVDQTGDNDF